MKRFYREGKDIEEKYNGWSPLMKAAEEGHVLILQLLLEWNADLEVTNENGRSALSFAAAPRQERSISVEALRILLEAGADFEKRDDRGQTAKARAQGEKRDAAIEVFEEFERKAVYAREVMSCPAQAVLGMGISAHRPSVTSLMDAHILSQAVPLLGHNMRSCVCLQPFDSDHQVAKGSQYPRPTVNPLGPSTSYVQRVKPTCAPIKPTVTPGLVVVSDLGYV